MQNEELPAWKIYERVVACLEINDAGFDVSVTPNAVLVGRLSGASRQIDVLIDARWEADLSRRIIIDAKRRSRRIDVKEVESFEGMMRDVGASRGVIVCTQGWSKAAARRAEQLIDIRLLLEEEALDFDFGCVDPCPHCRDQGRKPQGVVFWDGQLPLPNCSAWAIIFTGKCDRCRSFAFWCWDCGEKTVVPDGLTHECGCERKWFTEAHGDEVMFVVALEDGEVPLDRRPKN